MQPWVDRDAANRKCASAEFTDHAPREDPEGLGPGPSTIEQATPDFA